MSKNVYELRLKKNVGCMTVNGKVTNDIELPIVKELNRYHDLVENFDKYKWKFGSSKSQLEGEVNNYLSSLFSIGMLDLEVLWYIKRMPITGNMLFRMFRLLREQYSNEKELSNLDCVFPDMPFHNCIIDE